MVRPRVNVSTSGGEGPGHSFIPESTWGKVGAVAAVIAVVIALVAILQDAKIISLGPREDYPLPTVVPTTSPQSSAPDEPSETTASRAPTGLQIPRLVAQQEMTVSAPDCEIKGIDLDEFRVGASVEDAELAVGDDICQPGSVPFLQGVSGAPIALIDKTARVPGIDECLRGLRNSPSSDMTGLGPRGSGSFCFATTAGRIAGVGISAKPGSPAIDLLVVLWDVPPG
jgi:hypothetical protein